MNKQQFLDRLIESHKSKYDYSLVGDELSHKSVKIEIKCLECEIIFQQNFYSHINGHGCRKCQYKLASKLKKMSVEEFMNKAKEIHKELYDYSKSKYKQNKMSIKCNQCKSIFYQTTANHLQGHGCSKCYKKIISEKNKVHLSQYMVESINRFGDIFLYKNYTAKHSTVTIICKLCSFEFSRNGRDHLLSLGCPQCGQDRSNGERIIREYLYNNNIKYEREKTFPDLRGKTKNAVLRFDFYLPDLNIMIEFDGIHHFEFQPYSKDKTKEISDKDKQETMKRIRFNDGLKNKYCLENGYKLIRIKYDEKITERLDNEFKS